MNTIRLHTLNNNHRKPLWEIVKDIPDYFDDRATNKTMDEFFISVIDGLIGMKGDEVVGCAYLSDIYNGLGEINIFTKRHTVNHTELLKIIKNNLHYFFDKHNLKMLYAITHCENKACKRLLKSSGFHYADSYSGQEMIRGKKINGEMYVILREEVI
jgi:RimJ/RimL family protein N-acetyltransferase